MELTGREFEAIAEHAGETYLRYAFTKGTEQEITFLVDELGLEAGMRVLDVGCGPGRHTRALARLGIEGVGIDLAEVFLAAAGTGKWVRGDARALPFTKASFDAAISLCQGGFGLLGGEGESAALAEVARVTRPGGRLALTVPSAYFVVRHLEAGDTFDASSGVNHERVEVRDNTGGAREFDLWSTCFTPRELRLMAHAAGVRVRGLWSVRPGAYERRSPDLDHAEILLSGEV